MKNFKEHRKIILLVVIIIMVLLIVATTKKVVNNKKSKESQSILTNAEVVENNQKDDNIIVPIDDADVNIENINPEDTSWDEDAEETKVEREEEEKVKKESKNPYYIKINYTANVVTIYTKDSNGDYTVPVKALVCSTGKATPKSGVYKTSNKYRWHLLNGGVYGQYCTRITGHILFHSVPYATNSPDSLKYGAYDKLGTKASAGCIRLTVEDAMWVHNNCPSGTYVEFYGSSDPGPLGKPSAKKISSNEECRNWDPTDPDSRNPWHGYVEPKNTENAPEVQQSVEENKNVENTQNTSASIETNTNTTTNISIEANTNSTTNTNNNTSTTTNTNTNTNTNITTNTNTSTEKAIDKEVNKEKKEDKEKESNTDSNTNKNTNTSQNVNNNQSDNNEKQNKTEENITKEHD